MPIGFSAKHFHTYFNSKLSEYELTLPVTQLRKTTNDIELSE